MRLLRGGHAHAESNLHHLAQVLRKGGAQLEPAKVKSSWMVRHLVFCRHYVSQRELFDASLDD